MQIYSNRRVRLLLGSVIFIFSILLVFGLPLVIAFRKLSVTSARGLREGFIQCLVLVISLTAIFGILELTLQDMHPNEEAHRIAAERVASLLF